MNKIEVKILDSNLNGMPRFLARLTQRGHLINSMKDVISLYDDSIKSPPGKYLMTLPHTTIKRMNYITVAVSGLSTKCVSQLRTHAKRLTFISTSTQYSSFDNRDDNYVIPEEYLTEEQITQMQNALSSVQNTYNDMIKNGVDKDLAGYLLPQSLRKVVIMSGNLADWEYVLSLRMCHRNSIETQHVCKLIYKEIYKNYGAEYCVNMLPACVHDKCHEGKFCCGKKFEEEELCF